MFFLDHLGGLSVTLCTILGNQCIVLRQQLLVLLVHVTGVCGGSGTGRGLASLGSQPSLSESTAWTMLLVQLYSIVVAVAERQSFD